MSLIKNTLSNLSSIYKKKDDEPMFQYSKPSIAERVFTPISNTLNKIGNTPVNLNQRQQNFIQDTSYAGGLALKGLSAIPFEKQRKKFLGTPTSQEFYDIYKKEQSPFVDVEKYATDWGKYGGEVAKLAPAVAMTAAGSKGLLNTGVKLGSSALLGGGLSKAFGGSFSEGAEKGVMSRPGIDVVGAFTNPLISDATSKIYGSVGKQVSPLVNQLLTRTVVGGLNILEGIPMNIGLGYKGLTTEDAVIDFVTGFILNNPKNDYVEQQVKQAVKDLNVTGNKEVFKQSVEQIAKENNIKVDSVKIKNLVPDLATEKQELPKSYTPSKNTTPNIDNTLESRIKNAENIDKQLAKNMGGDSAQGNVKGAGMNYSSIRRAVNGTPTEIEIRNAKRYLDSMHSGKEVKVGDLNAISTGRTSFGKYEVTFEDGTTKYLDKNAINIKKTTDAQVKEYLKNKALSDLNYRENFHKQMEIANPSKNILPEQPEIPREAIPDEIFKGQDIKLSKNAEADFELLSKKLNLDEKGKQTLRRGIEIQKQQLEEVVGKPLTHDEVIKAAREAEMLTEATGRENTKKFAAGLQASKNYLKEQSEESITPEYLEQLSIVRSYASDAGRKLNAFKIEASEAPIKEKVLGDLKDLGIEIDKIIEEGNKVDWNDQKSIAAFYRKYNPAKLADYIEEFRYTNMLSNPKTTIGNVFSNALMSGVVTPVEKVISGGLDWAKSTLTGSEREYYASQGPTYSAAYIKALPKAWDSFKKIFSGSESYGRLELDRLPLTANKTWNIFTTPLKLMEASDKFFSTLVEEGELASLKKTGVEGPKASKLAKETADYKLFRQKFDPTGKTGQNIVLQVFDKWNSAVSNLRNVPGGKILVPFLQTPTNVLKQGIEYSPLGFATAPGAREPIEQISKALIGTSVFTAAYAMADAGLATWEAPINAKEKEAFYAAGLQPYSLKIGDKWYSYSKLGPLSYPIAMASAMKWADTDNADAELTEKLKDGVVGALGFFSDQSYVRGIGDILDAARGDDYKLSRALSNMPAQMTPYGSFLGWMARIIDPYYRKTTGDTLMERVVRSQMSQTPFLSKKLDPYTDPNGQPSERQYRFFNSLSPVSVTKENDEFKGLYEGALFKRRAAATLKKTKKQIEAGTYTGSAKDLNKNYGYDTYLTEPPTDSINQKIWIKNVEKEARAAWKDEDLPQELKEKMVAEMGMKPAEVELDVVANMGSNLEKAAWIQDKLETIPAENQMEFLSLLSTYKTMSGKYALTKGVAEELGIAGAYSALSAGKAGSTGGSGSKAKIKSTSSSTKSAKTSGAFSQPIKLAPYMQNMKKPSLSIDLDKLRKGEI